MNFINGFVGVFNSRVFGELTGIMMAVFGAAIGICLLVNWGMKRGGL